MTQSDHFREILAIQDRHDIMQTHADRPDRGEYRHMNFYGGIQFALLLLLTVSSGVIADSDRTRERPDIDPAASDLHTAADAMASLASQAHKLFVDLPQSAYFPITLHPGKNVALNTPTPVSFGIPFPRDVLFEPGSVSLASTRDEAIRATTVITSHWYDMHAGTPGSIRSVLVRTKVNFKQREPMTLYVKFNNQPIRQSGRLHDVRRDWVHIKHSVNPDEYAEQENIREPAVYVTLPPAWLSACLLRTRTLPLQQVDNMQWFDEAFKHFSDTAVNHVSEFVLDKNRIDYQQHYEPWLYDRAMTLFGIYIRTGELKWLRHAHRAAQYYAAHITSDGYFDRKKGYQNGPSNDLKYSYGQALLVDMMLTGDTRLLNKIEAIATAANKWNSQYVYQTQRPKLWTERHQAVALLAILTAWEATGKPAYADKLHTLFNHTLSQTTQPVANWTYQGCPLHAYKDHEGFGSNAPVCSSWMNALLAEGVFRYYLHSNNDKALRLLSQLGDYLQDSGTYVWDQGGAMQGLRMPHYLSSREFQRYPKGSWDDHHHACDVAAAAARSTWARNKLGENTASMLTLTQALLKTCQYNLNYMHRKDADKQHGKTVWRLSVPRQYNWWFGSTLDLGWLLSSQSMPE